MKRMTFAFFCCCMISIIFLFASIGLAQTPTTFSYQGRLNDGSAPANGTYEMQFKLFDGGGGQVGSTLTNTNVSVVQGIFSVTLDFGAAFDGTTRSLEIGVRPAGNPNPFVVLSPRQPVNASPYAIRAINSTTADAATNASQLGGVNANQYVLTSDSRLTDARSPTAGSTNYIQNTNSQQPASNFNISGNGTVGGTLSGSTVNSATQYNIVGNRVLSVAGTNNTFVGIGTGAVNSGVQNSFFGTSAGAANTSAVSNSFFGFSAGAATTGGGDNAFFGVSAGAANNSGFSNVFFGRSAGAGNTTGFNNSFFGRSAGATNTTGSNNTFIGNFADATSGTLTNATAIGAGATVSASNTIQIGRTNGLDTVNVSGVLNSDTEYRLHNFTVLSSNGSTLAAGSSPTGQTQTSSFGFNAGSSNTGSNNVYLGFDAGFVGGVSNGNSFLGAFSGFNIAGSNNTFVGLGASSSASPRVNGTAIGAQAQVSQDNSLVLGSISGVNGATASTNVGIGTTAPKTRLDVRGGDIYVGDSGVGVILRSPGGNCFRITVSDAGVLTTSSVTCP